MIINGKLYYQVISGGGTDGNDDPIPATESWSEPIDCNIKVNNRNNKGKYFDSSFVMASYDVLIEADDFTAARIKLEDTNGHDLGEYSIQSISPLTSVGRIKITV